MRIYILVQKCAGKVEDLDSYSSVLRLPYWFRAAMWSQALAALVIDVIQM